MKKLFFLLFFFFFLGFSSFSQRYYLSYNMGWNNSLAIHDFRHGNFIETSVSSGNYTVAAFSLGKGFTNGLGVGYNLNKMLDVEMEVNGLLGYKNKIYYQSLSGTKQGTHLQGRMLRVLPQLVLKTELNTTYTAYAKLGLIVGAFGQIRETRYGDKDIDYLDISTKGLSYGVTGSMGIKRKLKKEPWLGFIECRIIGQSFGPKQSEIVKKTYKGMDLLKDLEIGEKLTYYKESHIETFEIDLTKPLETTKLYYPFSSVGINIGVQYQF